MKHLTFLLAAAFVLSGSVYGQTELPKQISGGVLNGKAVKLPKPAYPPAARAVNAEGAVSVQVLIDETGKVISAAAVSGHPLLRVAATEAAQQAEFTPTLLQGNPVKVSGVVTYNFVGPLTPGMLGYEIAYAQKAGQFRDMMFANSLASRLPEALSAEKNTLETLTYEESKPGAEPPAARTDHDGRIVTVKGLSSAYSAKRLTGESIERLRVLEMAVEGKLSSAPETLWNYRLGKTLGAMVAEIDDADKLRSYAAELEALAASTPTGFTSGERLRALIERIRTADGGLKARAEITSAASELRNVRVARW